jgi:hypothetical protein
MAFVYVASNQCQSYDDDWQAYDNKENQRPEPVGTHKQLPRH